MSGEGEIRGWIRGLSRREILAGGAGAGAAIALGEAAAATPARVARSIEFTARPDRPGWGRGWRTVGVANLRIEGGEGILEAGSDVFPNDPRPVVFATDARFRDGEIRAELTRIGGAPGVVIRRAGPVDYYAAVYDAARLALRILRRQGSELRQLASAPVLVPPAAPATLTLSAAGASPAELRATLTDANGLTTTASARNGHAPLQRSGDAGVLATAETLFPHEPNPIHPAYGNFHLLPWGVQEGQAFMATELGEAIVAEIRRRSTAAFARITITSSERRRRSRPHVIAATTGTPLAGGARIHVASDRSAKVRIEVADNPRFRGSRMVGLGRTGRFHALDHRLTGLPAGERVFWRAHLTRKGVRSTGPVRSFRVMPRRDQASGIRIAIAACGSQFGPIFGHLANREPHAFIWQGDLNYPDTHGPLAQTMAGYAGIWRDFLSNPVLEPIVEQGAFAAQRDDHDYALQDANRTNIDRVPWGLAPWDALMNPRTYFRFSAGPADVWVLDQRRWKSDPADPDAESRTLLGPRQRRWLLRTLQQSQAKFKVICSPGTVFMGENPRDGNWDAGYEVERDRLLGLIRREVAGEVIFVSGDVHLAGVFEAEDWFEARAAPIGIPQPNDITLQNPRASFELRERPGVIYADDRCHFAMLELSGRGRGAKLDLAMVREDGVEGFRRRFG